MSVICTYYDLRFENGALNVKLWFDCKLFVIVPSCVNSHGISMVIAKRARWLVVLF